MDVIEPLQLEKLAGFPDLAVAASRHGDDYICCNISGNLDGYATSLFRFDGIVVLLCNRGEISLCVNLTTITLSASNMFIFNMEDTVTHVESSDDLELSVLGIGREFLRDVNFNLQILERYDVLTSTLNATTLSPKDYEDISSYFILLTHNAEARRQDDTSDLFTRNIARNLIASILYHFISLRKKQRDVVSKSASRRMGYVYDFIQLVHTHYRRERTIKFYADKLFISPKYLSLIIKEGTGSTAAEWIDRCVIMEAKNLLRFSNMNVQQVAYELNFSNQSSFGKYFKHLVGMSPSQFQKS
ncbi:MAG: AraC family transcriptional regulator [Muribaculaceae bacterium]|nr:AraC family transcriptional regulator [Muribaculaceae bacterium]